MYSKVFQQIFDSSISDDHVVRHVFMDLLVLADRHGVVDMTIPAIARRTNVPIELVSHAISKLTDIDPTSRTETEDGRRMIRLDDHRDWGWTIVNFAHYNAMRNEEARREYFREYKQKQREAKRGINNLEPIVLDNIGHSTVSTPTDAYADADLKAPERKIVRRVFVYYIEKLKRSPKTYTLTEPRMNKGIVCFRHAMKVADGDVEKAEGLMMAAVDGLLKNDWNMGRTQRSTKTFTEWGEHIFRSPDVMEKRWEDYERGR
jgi:hypothetical protein